ncbi:MAG: tRNA (adenosine(37)-N6)-threonylcarbamoyltransferase complex ATPase subunit type 1 TsaE [Planctomycetota bacterium]|jgi:tRNA threonylcarbamoyladenosine biosynthesis protein TsaE
MTEPAPQDLEATTLELVTQSARETADFARRLAERLRPGDLVALHGELGAGKTTFVRGLAEGLGLDPGQVSSPTFVLCQEYEDSDAVRRLAHIDAYRLGGVEELEGLGFDELLRSGDVVVAVEWAERIAPALPDERVDVDLEHENEQSRRLTLRAGPSLADRLPRATACLTCGRTVPPTAPTFPFCRPRCRDADLGRWLGGNYRISRPIWDDEAND